MFTIPTSLTDAALFALVVGFFLPILIDLILQSGWSDRRQSVVAFLVIAVFGTGTAFFSGAFNGVGVVTAVLIVFVMTITAYKGLWKNVAPQLKARTTFTSQR